MAVEGQPLLPAKAPAGSKKGLLAWLRNSPILAFVLVAVFAAGLLSHIARSDTAQSVTALTQRAAGEAQARWGGKAAAALPAQDETAAEDEAEAEDAEEATAVPGTPIDSDAAADSSDPAKAQQAATDGGSTPSQDGDGGNTQPADGGGHPDGAAAGRQQVGGDPEQAAGVQQAADGGAQPADSGEQQHTTRQEPPAVGLTLEEVRRRPWQSLLAAHQHAQRT